MRIYSSVTGNLGTITSRDEHWVHIKFDEGADAKIRPETWDKLFKAGQYKEWKED